MTGTAAAAEAARLGRYVLGAEPPSRIARRYREAVEILVPGPRDALDQAIDAFALQHPWSIPLLDAATAVLRPAALLRRKIIVMTAILETTPDNVRRFEASCPGRFAALLRLVGWGTLAVLKLKAGIVLYAWLRLRA